MAKIKRWKEPPPKRSQGGRPKGSGAADGAKHASLISELSRKPGKWALLDHGDRSPTAVYSELAALPGYEFTTRGTGDDLVIYGRCLEPEEVAS